MYHGKKFFKNPILTSNLGTGKRQFPGGSKAQFCSYPASGSWGEHHSNYVSPASVFCQLPQMESASDTSQYSCVCCQQGTTAVLNIPRTIPMDICSQTPITTQLNKLDTFKILRQEWVMHKNAEIHTNLIF